MADHASWLNRMTYFELITDYNLTELLIELKAFPEKIPTSKREVRILGEDCKLMTRFDDLFTIKHSFRFLLLFLIGLN